MGEAGLHSHRWTSGRLDKSSARQRESAVGTYDSCEAAVEELNNGAFSNVSLRGVVPSPEDVSDISLEAGLDFNQLRDVLRYAFMNFDLNGDGCISLSEFRAACNIMGFEATTETLSRLFMAHSKGKESLFPADVKDALEEDLEVMVLGQLKRWYSESGMIKGEYFLVSVWQAFMDTKVPLEARWHSGLRILRSQGEHLLEFLEFVVASGLLLQKLQCFPECGNVDATDLVPMLVLLFKSTRAVADLLEDRSTGGLDYDSATAFALAFKPAGFSVVDFQDLIKQTEAKWITLPAGSKLPMEVFEYALAVVSAGRLRIQEPSAVAPGLVETSLEVSAGSFLGSSSFLDDSFKTRRFNPRQYALVTEDVTLLRWDVDVLRQFLSAHKEYRRKLQYALSRSVVRSMSLAKAQSEKISRELPLLFRDMLLAVMRNFHVDKASIWVHDPARKALWTLFVEEDGKSQHFDIPDDSGLAGHCFSSGVALNIPDCYVDDRFHVQVDKLTGYHTKSMLCIPVVDAGNGDQPIGVLQLINRLETRIYPQSESSPSIVAFSDADLETAQDIMWQTRLMVRRLQKRYGTTDNS